MRVGFRIIREKNGRRASELDFARTPLTDFAARRDGAGIAVRVILDGEAAEASL